MSNQSDSQTPTPLPEAEPVAEDASQEQESNPLLDAVDDAFLRDLFSSSPAAPAEAPAPKPAPSRLSGLWKSLLAHRAIVLFSAAVLLILAIVAAVAFGGAPLSDRFVRLLRYTGEQTEFNFDVHQSNAYASFHSGLAVASVDGLLILDEDGTESALMQNQMDPPVLLNNGTVALSYGVGGSSICTAHYSKGPQLQLTVPGVLYDAYLSSDSCIGYAFSQSGYKAVLAVLDRGGNELYRWYSSTQFFQQCAVSKGGAYLAGIALGYSGTNFETTAVMFSTKQDQPTAQLSLGGDLMYELAFLDEQRLCAVGESSLHFFDVDGGHHMEYPYQGGQLLRYALGGLDFTALALDMNQAGSRYRLITVDANGQELASTSFNDEIIDLSCNGGYLAVLTSTELHVYDRTLRQTLSSVVSGSATKACVQSDGAVILIEGGHGLRVS